MESLLCCGALIGDFVGSRFEGNNIKTKDFELLHKNCRFTDDSIMTLAIFDALVSCNGNYDDLGSQAVKCMRKMGKRFPYAGYGGRFYLWLKSENPEPYGSFGNGSAMRVSGCGLLADNLEMAERLAVRTAEVTHNHEEGIKGAVAVAGAVWLAKHGRSMDEIRQYAQRHYNMDFTISEIRKEYRFSETCQGSVPQALECFLESTDFDDALRNAVSIGGDSDTIAAIACSIAGPFWGVPRKYDSVIAKLDETNRRLISDFAKACYA